MTLDRSDTPKSKALWQSGFWLLSGLILLPLWLISPLPLVDLPLHTARAHVMHEYSSNAFLQQIYTLVLEPTPNVGGEVIMMLLQQVMPVGIAMKMLLTLTLLLFCIGMRSIIQLFFVDRNWLPLLVPLLAFNLMFLFGLLNYIIGFGLFCLTFKYWYSRSSEKGPIRAVELLVVAILSLGCYFSHLSSYAFLGVAISTVLGYEMVARSDLLKLRFISALPAAIPMLFFLLFMRGSGTNTGTTYGDLQGKITTLLLMLTSYEKIFDALLILGILAAMVIAFMAARERQYNKVALLLTAVFALCFALCPATLFTSQMADARLVPVICAFALATIRLKLNTALAGTIIAAVIGMLTVRSAMIVLEWSELSLEMEKQLVLADRIPNKAHVRTLYHYEDVVLSKRERPFRHLLSYKMIDRDLVLSSFIGLPGQQPIVFRRQPDPVLLEHRVPLTNRGLDTLTNGYDYIWTYKLSSHEDSLLASRYPSIGRIEDARVYQIVQ